MTGRDTEGRARKTILWAAGLLLAVTGAAVFFAVRGDSSDLTAMGDSGKRFLTALGSGDGEDACALMTRTARSDLAAGRRTDTCPEAVEALIGPLDETQRGDLADSYESRFFERDGSLGHVNVDTNALQISELTLAEVDGKWLVTGWK